MIENFEVQAEYPEIRKKTNRPKVFSDFKGSLAAMSFFAGDQPLDLYLRR